MAGTWSGCASRYPPISWASRSTSLNIPGKLLVAGVSRGGGGFIPTEDSVMQAGDYLAVIMAKDGMDLLDEQLAPPSGDHA